MKNCAKCGRDFADTEGFLTCPGCRLYDTGDHKMKNTQCRRSSPPRCWIDTMPKITQGVWDNIVAASEE